MVVTEISNWDACEIAVINIKNDARVIVSKKTCNDTWVKVYFVPCVFELLTNHAVSTTRTLVAHDYLQDYLVYRSTGKFQPDLRNNNGHPELSQVAIALCIKELPEYLYQ